MKSGSLLILGILVSLIFINPGLILAQQASPEKQSAIQVTDEMETQWLWGDVASIDSQGKTLTVKYFDYDTDSEREMKLVVDTKTTFENIMAFEEIRPQDTVSIDYIANPTGDNVARNISVEKPEEPQAQKEVIQQAQPPQQPEVTAQSEKADESKPQEVPVSAAKR